MLNENLRNVRKQKGLSQQELAIRLNVVRQTVSKWEKGLSVPDADMLVKIAEILEVSVEELLGEKISNNEERNEIVEQLVRINEQFAIKNRRTKTVIKIVVGIIIGFFVINIFLIAIGAIAFKAYQIDTKTYQIETKTEVHELVEEEP